MKKILFTLAALALIAASCNKTDDVNIETQPRTVRVSASMPTTTETRTSFYDGAWNATAGYGFKVKWAPGDKISILCWQGDDAANWGKLISDKDYFGTVTTDKGEIIHTLTAEEISADGRKINFNFTIPTQLTDNTQPVKALITYVGNSYYTIAKNLPESAFNGKPWLKVQHPRIDNAADRAALLYATRTTPMTLRGEIAAGWATGATQAVFDGQFKHLTTLFAVQIKNNTAAPIDPGYVSVNFADGTVMDNGYNYWNPITPVVPATANMFGEIDIYHSQTIAPGASFVYFIPVYILTAPTKISAAYVDRNSSYYPITSTKENTSISLQAGKCYTLRVVVNSITQTGAGTPNTDFAWDTAPATQAPWE